MTQATVTRLNKRNNKKVQDEQLGRKSLDVVENARLSALKPYIQEQIALTAQQITRGVYQFIMQERAGMQTRQLAFERILNRNVPWFTEEVLAMEVAEVEDEAQGLVPVAATEAVQENDKVRLTFTAMPHGKDTWMDPSKLCIHAVGRKGPNGAVQTHDALEAALVGMVVGDTREFLVPEPVEEGKEPEFTKCSVTVMRVSRVKGV